MTRRLYISEVHEGLSTGYLALPRDHMGAEPWVMEADDKRGKLLRRCYDAMSRREPDGISDAKWDRLLRAIEKEIGIG